MDVHKFIVVMLTLSTLMAEQMDWGDNADLVEKTKYIEDRKNVKLLVVFEGEDIDLECQVFYTSEPVGNIVWKIDAKEEKTNERPILSYEYGEVFIQSHLQMSNISRDRDGSTVSCNYAKGQYGGSMRAVLAVFMMQFCQAGGGDVRVMAKEAGRDSPGETFVEDRIKDKIRNITGEHKVMLENGEYSVTVPYNSLIGNRKLTHLYPQLVKDGLNRIHSCDDATIIIITKTNTSTKTITSTIGTMSTSTTGDKTTIITTKTSAIRRTTRSRDATKTTVRMTTTRTINFPKHIEATLITAKISISGDTVTIVTRVKLKTNITNEGTNGTNLMVRNIQYLRTSGNWIDLTTISIDGYIIKIQPTIQSLITIKSPGRKKVISGWEMTRTTSKYYSYCNNDNCYPVVVYYRDDTD